MLLNLTILLSTTICPSVLWPNSSFTVTCYPSDHHIHNPTVLGHYLCFKRFRLVGVETYSSTKSWQYMLSQLSFFMSLCSRLFFFVSFCKDCLTINIKEIKKSECVKHIRTLLIIIMKENQFFLMHSIARYMVRRNVFSILISSRMHKNLC